ncbi:MAG: 1-deoxy-D-xylulose-5-phosphate reductoisomerase, partial [Ruminococcus sp.]|nr:1-deoxy-D-xylulose-5-phosphate reductoisomerase [Ruminococcus sp.]
MNISVIGSTGSIGTQTLEIARAHDINVIALTAGKNVKLLASQAREFRAKRAVIAEEKLFGELKLALADTDIKAEAGAGAIAEAAAIKVDRVVNASVGIAGLLPTEAAIKACNDVALANKETLVAGGEYIMGLIRGSGV